jgi:soluble lytic murein transglycosylase
MGERTNGKARKDLRTGRLSRQLAWRLAAACALVAIVAAGIVLWVYRDALRSPRALYRQAQSAAPERAAALYNALARKVPEIEEYARLWAAEARMPDLEALQDLKAVADFRPKSPAAQRAHVVLARYYATLEAPEAEEAYREALEVDASVSLRMELASYLEERGDNEAAYAEYSALLREQHDAFEGMRRTAPSALTVAQDLNAAFYFSDAVEVLRGVEDPAVLPVRAEALKGLGRNEEAREAYEAWLEISPDDEEARQALAEVRQALGMPAEPASQEEGDERESPADEPAEDSADDPEDHPEGNSDSKAGEDADGDSAGQADSPEEAPDEVDLYLESPYPADWWTATTLLETQGRLTETLPVYARIARTDTYLADDAAYRLYVLGERLADADARAEAEQLLRAFDLSWLALRATGEEIRLPTTPPLAEAGGEVVAKAQALESIGRPALARLELVLVARFRRAPEVDLAMARALASRGYVLDAQPIAERTIGERGRAPRAFWELSFPRPYSATVMAAAAEFDVDPHLIWSVMRQESRFDPAAFGYVAERGLMQILPTTQDWIAEQLGEEISPGAAFTPEANVRMGAWYLRHLLDYYDGEQELAITAYNGGPGNVDGWRADPLVSTEADFIRWIGFGSTREYLETVSLNYRIYGELYGDE